MATSPASASAQYETSSGPLSGLGYDPDAKGRGSAAVQERSATFSKDELIMHMRSLRTADPVEPKRPRQHNDTPGNAYSGGNLDGRRPRFGDLTPYGIDDKHEAQLWELEAQRLLNGLAEDRVSLHVPDAASPSTLSHDINSLGFARLEKLSDQLLCALAVCGLDDQIVLARANQARAPANSAILARSVWKLETRLETNPHVRQIAQARRERRTRRHRSPLDDKHDTLTSTDVQAVTGGEVVAYYAVVDYITLILARLVLPAEPSLERIHWHGIVTAALAKVSTKLKVLCHDLPTFGLDALHNNTKLRKLFPDLDADNLSSISELKDILGIVSGHDLDAGITQAPDAHIATYTSDMGEASCWLFRMLWRILTDLTTRDTRGKYTDEFDISVFVYATSSRNIPTMAYQDRQGHVMGSTSEVAVGLCHRAFALLHGAASSVRDNTAARQKKSSHKGATSELTIKTTSDDMKDLTVIMGTISDIISVMVALSCMDSSITESLRKVWSTVQASTIVPALHGEAQGFTAFAKLCNKSSVRQDGGSIQSSGLRSSLPLSQSILAKDDVGVASEVRATQRFRRRRETLYSARMRNHVSTAARHWAVEENAIVVGCLRYTTCVLSVCAALVVGGLAAGFLVGSRIDGVDPFNLTMFSWIIAGFIILLSKSVRVAEWSWRDFLRGRVRCRSVHELARVTGIEDQGIIMHLLSLEDEMPIVTKGPYNRLFSRADQDGFSIDVKPTIGTLIVSGLLVLEVLTESGPALVCLDLRDHVAIATAEPTTELRRYPDTHELSRRIVHSQRRSVRVLACKELPNDNEKDRDVVFQWQHLQWEKVIGMYDDVRRKVW